MRRAVASSNRRRGCLLGLGNRLLYNIWREVCLTVQSWRRGKPTVEQLSAAKTAHEPAPWLLKPSLAFRSSARGISP